MKHLPRALPAIALTVLLLTACGESQSAAAPKASPSGSSVVASSPSRPAAPVAALPVLPSTGPVAAPYFTAIRWEQVAVYPGALSFQERGLRPGASVTIGVTGTASVSFVCLAQNPARQANPITRSRSITATVQLVADGAGVGNGFVALAPPDATGWTCPAGYLGGPSGSSYAGFRLLDGLNRVAKAIDTMTSGG